MPVFIVDTNFFIQAHRSFYPLDVAVSYWKTIKKMALQGKIISIDKVKGEIYKNEDALKQWCLQNLPEGFFHDSATVIHKYGAVTSWAVSQSGHYTQKALAEFLDADEADAFLVAYALANPDNRFIVTQEISQPNRKSKIKIPEACNAFNIKYFNVIEMFRILEITF